MEEELNSITGFACHGEGCGKCEGSGRLIWIREWL